MSMYSPKLWVAIAVIVVLLLGWDYWGTELQFLTGSSTATGTIIGCDMNGARLETNAQTMLTYDYIVDNTVYSAVLTVGGYACNTQYAIGDKLEITYLNRSPEIARIKPTNSPLISLTCVIVFVLTLMLAVPYLIRKDRYPVGE